jgi:hypothetical protein
MSYWRRGSGGREAPEDNSGREVSGSSRSSGKVFGSSASGRGRDLGSGSGSDSSLEGGGSIGEAEAEAEGRRARIAAGGAK